MPIVATHTFPNLSAAVERMYAGLLGPGEQVRITPAEPLDAYGFQEFCAQYPSAVAELEPDGTITLMSPLTLLSNENESEPFADLKMWHRRAQLGKVFSSTAGFKLPDGSVRSPDAAWVSPERLAALSPSDYDTMAELVPDFIIEVMSKDDSLRPAKMKMLDTWMANGVRLGWLLWPKRNRAYVYRAGKSVPEELHGFERELNAGDVVPGFTLDLRVLLATGL